MAQHFASLGHDLGGALRRPRATLSIPAHGQVGPLPDQEGCTSAPSVPRTGARVLRRRSGY